jgi:hypothetical protein
VLVPPVPLFPPLLTVPTLPPAPPMPWLLVPDLLHALAHRMNDITAANVKGAQRQSSRTTCIGFAMVNLSLLQAILFTLYQNQVAMDPWIWRSKTSSVASVQLQS